MRRYLLFASERYALGILRPLQAAIRDRGEHCAWLLPRRLRTDMREDEHVLSGPAAVGPWKPDAVFVPGNWVPASFPGIKVEVFHGFSTGKRSEHRGHFRIRGFFDLYCTQGPATTEPFRGLAARHGHFRVEETGWPKLDPLFREPGVSVDADAAGDARPVVLYASTFTRSLTSAPALLETIAREAARGRWRWLVTFHPKMPAEIVRAYRALEGEHLQFVDTDDVLPLLRRADVMLCDTSSILHEFLVLQRPVVTLRNRAPGPELIDVESPESVVPALERALTPAPDLLAAIRAYAQRIHPYRDGRSSERVLAATERFLARGRTGLRRKPLNLWRRVRTRGRLAEYAAD